tara:strand:- start:36 stop:1265 length:1230 start_codon:yes stop_codon:yes gene_type:complete
MSNINENHGYAVEGKLMESTKGYLVLWSINAGTMRYADLVAVAKSNSLSQGKIPKLRTAKNAFAKAKDAIQNSSLPVLLELEGWDGAVKQSVDVKHLMRGNEYQISIRREGRMNGKLHKESTPVFRLEFSPPDTFDHVAWVQNYMRSFWDEAYIKQIEDGEVERPVPSQTLCCIRIEGYWNETEINIDLMSQVQRQISEAFQNTIVSIDETLLRQHIKDTLVSLRGVNFLAGKGVSYVPTKVNGVDTSTSLDSVANIIASFARGYEASVNNENYYGEDGNPVNRYGTKSNFRYLGYLDGEREMQYIREDLGSDLSKEITEFHAEVTKLAGAFDTEKVEQFEARISKLRVKKSNITKRLASAEELLGGNIPVKRKMYADVNNRLRGRIANIPMANDAVTASLVDLTNFDN